jgi:hypothetical protein
VVVGAAAGEVAALEAAPAAVVDLAGLAVAISVVAAQAAIGS